MPEHPRFMRMRPRARGMGASVVIALLTASMLAALPANGAPTGRPHVRVLAPGVAITTYIDRRFPIRTYVLTVDPSQGASLGVALSNDRLAGLEKTSDIAKRLGAIAAVNGDFGFTSGRPVHPFVLDGDLVQTSNAFGVLFTIAGDGTMRIAKPTKQAISVTEVDTGETWPVATWNDGRPAAGEIAAFTAAGTGLDQPRPSTCSARFLPAGPSSPTGDGVTRTYSVDQSGCFSSSLPTQDGVVLSAAPTTDEATFLRSLTPGETVDIAWSFGIPGVKDAIGGDRILVNGGRVALGPCTGAGLRTEPANRDRPHRGRASADRGGGRSSEVVRRHVPQRARPVHGQPPGSRGRHEPGRRRLERHGGPGRGVQPSRRRLRTSGFLGRPRVPRELTTPHRPATFGPGATLDPPARLVVERTHTSAGPRGG